MEHASIESRVEENVDVITGEVNFAVKELVAKKKVTLVGEVLDEALRQTPGNAPSEIRSIVYNALVQVMLDLLRT